MRKIGKNGLEKELYDVLIDTLDKNRSLSLVVRDALYKSGTTPCITIRHHRLNSIYPICDVLFKVREIVFHGAYGKLILAKPELGFSPLLEYLKREKRNGREYSTNLPTT